LKIAVRSPRGKNGQGVPVGVGQPTLLIDGLTIGGMAA
jgi:TldD protein